MVTERYAHILDDDRRLNAERFQKEFYSGQKQQEPKPEELLQPPVPAPEPEENPADLLKLLTQSPELATILKALSIAIQ